MRKKGKSFFGFCSKNLSPSVAHYSNSSPTTSGAAVAVSISCRRFCEATIVQKIESTTAMIMKWSTESLAYAETTSMFHQNRREALLFIESVNDLQRIMHFLAFENSADAKLKFLHTLMKIAMKRLQGEFYRILSVERESSDAQSCSERLQLASDSISEVRRVSSAAMADLRTIAECMISSGYAKECIEIYTAVRKSIVDEWIYNLGVVKLSSRVIDQKALDFRIKNWMNAVKIATKTIFNTERVLSHNVFASSGSVAEFCFNNTCKDGAMLLFKLPEMIVKSKKSQKNDLFLMLDMFSTISENQPEIESIFSFESTEAIRSQAFASLGLLAEWISARLSDYESSFQRDSSNSLSTDSGIHTITLQSMIFLRLLSDYQESLSTILDRQPLSDHSSLSDPQLNTSDCDDSPFPTTVSTCFARLIFVVLCKLDCKSRQFEDISLTYLFLANNVRHVVAKVRDSKLRWLVGEEWIAHHEAKVKQYIAGYKRLAWGKVYSSLPENPTADLSTAEIMEVYEEFGSAFKEAYRKQRSRVVSDFKLREEIVSSLAESFVPTYREFYNAHRIPVTDELCARFTPGDVQYYLSNLFLAMA